MGKKKRSLIIEEVSLASKEQRKVGPILPSFQHGVCDPAGLVSITRGCSVSADWPEAGQPRLQVSSLNLASMGVVVVILADRLGSWAQNQTGFNLLSSGVSR